MEKRQWIHLQDKKSLSRLLYTNPVCFLTASAATTSTSFACRDDTCIDSNGHAGGRTGTAPSSSPRTRPSPRRNVMVVSWLTPINNNARFMMSINKRRHTASLLASTSGTSTCSKSEPSVKGEKECSFISESKGGANGAEKFMKEFVLCVPVAGMEELVLDVGKTSGRWGRSKFPLDHDADGDKNDRHMNTIDVDANENENENVDADTTSKRNPKSNKKRRAKTKIEFINGIQGLTAIKLGTSNAIANTDSDADSLFAIKGTVAHLKCKVHSIPFLDENKDDKDNDTRGAAIIDDDHYLIVCDILEAFILSDYWDVTKKRFIPMKQQQHKDSGSISESGSVPPPYLTFFGSQSFGYISTMP
eukprot:CAMPEP_0203664306 /NCGR_PEP_ID=MMETSP0090-20130426/1738_1 /ASSEMBLY_ACC=CAM_ASM_001088 /TAXON_ID=426623 /ORGANISM="Chaetoceros affinis, Strain CCMP159" /LENGTH=360 /DNA_ID=CAMNT_0050527507 /DNA_START=241 /DNA_END=1323 /DNA_ORIENTATION=-